MKIYSWNILFKNRELERALAFIRDSEWDIFCLQEVHEHFLARLRELPFGLVAAPESDGVFSKKRYTQYVVILSRHPVEHTGSIALFYYDPSITLAGRVFKRALYDLGLWARGLGNRHGVYADIKTPSGAIRVFNLHLSLLSPKIRMEEFETAMAARDSTKPMIVCGDFNILEKAHITPLNLILGGGVGDAIFYRRERTRLERRFFEYELVNPHRGKSTHGLSRSQLDHILVSNSFSIKNAEVIKERYGSDHCPIRVDIS